MRSPMVHPNLLARLRDEVLVAGLKTHPATYLGSHADPLNFSVLPSLPECITHLRHFPTSGVAAHWQEF